MHKLYEKGDLQVKPNVVTYGAVIDAYAKSGEKHAAARADALLAKMIHLNQMDPSTYSDLRPNTYVFNTVINAHAKSKEVRAVFNTNVLSFITKYRQLILFYISIFVRHSTTRHPKQKKCF